MRTRSARSWHRSIRACIRRWRLSFTRRLTTPASTESPATKHEPEGDTLAERLHTRLVERLGTDDSTVLADAVEKVSDEIRGRTASPSMLTLMELASIVSVCCWTRRRNFLPVRVPEGSPGQLRSSAHASMTGKYK